MDCRLDLFIKWKLGWEVLKGFVGISIDVNGGIKAKPIISDLELHGINFNGMVYNLTKRAKEGLNEIGHGYWGH